MLGVDVNSEYVQMLEVCLKKQHFYIQNVAKQAFSAKTLAQHALGELINKTKPKMRQCIAALPINLALHKTLPLMPGLSKTELKTHIEHEVLTALPTKTDVVWDYCYQGKENKLSVVIAQQENIKSYLELFDMNGLILKIMDVESFALVRAWRACYPKLLEANDLYAVVLKRTHYFLLVIMHKGRLISVRSITQLEQLASNFDHEHMIKKLWLAGDTIIAEEIALLANCLNIPVSLVEINENFSGISADDAPTLFLNIGIALWGKC